MALHEAHVWGSGGVAPRILNLGTRLRWMFNYTPRSLYPIGKGSRNAFNRRLSRTQSQSARYGERKPVAFVGNQHDSLINRWQPSHGAPSFPILCCLCNMDPEERLSSFLTLTNIFFAPLNRVLRCSDVVTCCLQARRRYVTKVMGVGVLRRRCVTEHRGRMGRKNSFCICRGSGDRLPVREVIRGFCQPLADVGVVPYVKPSRIPYAAFPLNYGQIVLSFDVY